MGGKQMYRHLNSHWNEMTNFGVTNGCSYSRLPERTLIIIEKMFIQRVDKM